MEPQEVAKLMQTPEGRALARFLDATIEQLDTTTGVADLPTDELAIEVKARARAAEKLRDALSTLLSFEPRDTMNSEPNEYAVD